MSTWTPLSKTSTEVTWASILFTWANITSTWEGLGFWQTTTKN
jgi:hypothetical protein